MLAFGALDLRGHPEHRAVVGSAIVVGQIKDACLDEEADRTNIHEQTYRFVLQPCCRHSKEWAETCPERKDLSDREPESSCNMELAQPLSPEIEISSRTGWAALEMAQTIE
ncbi:hypothetical protein X771_00145 [Mesorhizobium sp. LSJC277A00]|nr:hypothetical protein X771_00145 [Mesorhizobium sp. LSJC277A00]ESY41438.1 hypothetical protein X746_25740 [Mesorhizobium sp. LNJC380A00]